jgi:hypothetical protein
MLWFFGLLSLAAFLCTLLLWLTISAAARRRSPRPDAVRRRGGAFGSEVISSGAEAVTTAPDA